MSGQDEYWFFTRILQYSELLYSVSAQFPRNSNTLSGSLMDIPTWGL